MASQGIWGVRRQSLLGCLQSPDLPKTLASICNDIVVEGSLVCQAFTWDYAQQKGYFKGQHVNDPYNKDDLIANFTMCNSPSVTTWILNAGKTRSVHVRRRCGNCHMALQH